MLSKDHQLVAQLTAIIQAIQNILSLKSETYDFSKDHSDVKFLLENFDHVDLSIDFYNAASEAIKTITKLRHTHPTKQHIFIHLDNIVELLRNVAYKHPLLKKSKFTKTKIPSSEEMLKRHVSHAKEIIEEAEKAYAETTRILHSLQQQCELENMTPELTERIKHAATRMHLINMAATIAADRITSINNELQKKF